MEYMSGWWLTYPSEKYESQWGWDYPIYEMEKKSHVPNHQPDRCWVPQRRWMVFFAGNPPPFGDDSLA